MLSVPFGYKMEWSCVNVFMEAHLRLRQNYNYSRQFSARGKGRGRKSRTGFKGALWDILGCCASFTGLHITMSEGWKVGLTTNPKVWICDDVWNPKTDKSSFHTVHALHCSCVVYVCCTFCCVQLTKPSCVIHGSHEMSLWFRMDPYLENAIK